MALEFRSPDCSPALRYLPVWGNHADKHDFRSKVQLSMFAASGSTKRHVLYRTARHVAHRAIQGRRTYASPFAAKETASRFCLPAGHFTPVRRSETSQSSRATASSFAWGRTFAGATGPFNS